LLPPAKAKLSWTLQGAVRPSPAQRLHVCGRTEHVTCVSCPWWRDPRRDSHEGHRQARLHQRLGPLGGGNISTTTANRYLIRQYGALGHGGGAGRYLHFEEGWRWNRGERGAKLMRLRCGPSLVECHGVGIEIRRFRTRVALEPRPRSVLNIGRKRTNARNIVRLRLCRSLKSVKSASAPTLAAHHKKRSMIASPARRNQASPRGSSGLAGAGAFLGRG